MHVNMETIPFSRRGSYFVLSYMEKWQTIVLRDVHGGDLSPSELFLLKINHQLCDLKSENFLKNFKISTTETNCIIQSLQNPQAFAEIIFPTEKSVRIRVNQLVVTFQAVKERYDTFYQQADEVYEYISYKKDQRYQLLLLSGKLQVEAPWHAVGNTEISLTLDATTLLQELVIVNDKIATNYSKSNFPSFDEAKQLVEKELALWRENLALKKPTSDSDEMASYLLWSCQVHKEKTLTRDSLYMSKNWMQNIWSWDNCFSALGVAKANPALAYEQFAIFSDHQDESGAYPDFINDTYVSFSCVKPPIHGWAYQRLIQQDHYFAEETRLKKMYDSIAKATNFWLTKRKQVKTGLIYYSHGNDSGWDNASIFKAGMPVSAPDLIAYLALQCGILAEWATTLAFHESSKKWHKTKEKLLQQLLTLYYNKENEQFVALNARTGEALPIYDSLILYLPLLLGNDLPIAIQEPLVRQLLAKFEGTYGLATESPQSPFYREAGYWLGPIWAPVSYLLIHGLKKSGYLVDAQRLANKFSQLVAIGGMAENFNPTTGVGNDDLAFAWTSSVYLMLAQNNF